MAPPMPERWRTKTSSAPFESPPTRFVAALVKAYSDAARPSWLDAPPVLGRTALGESGATKPLERRGVAAAPAFRRRQGVGHDHPDEHRNQQRRDHQGRGEDAYGRHGQARKRARQAPATEGAGHSQAE